MAQVRHHKPVSLYLLVCPKTHQPKYVGQSVNPRTRLNQHLAQARKGVKRHLCNWLRSLIAEGLEPEILILEEVHGQEWPEREQWWIQHFRSLGCKLCNLTDGGEGIHGYELPEEVRAKYSAWQVGRKLPEETRRKMSEARKGMKLPPRTPEQIAKHAAALRGKPLSEEHRAKLSAAGKGRPKSAEHRAKIGAANTGRPVSEETREKIRQSKLRQAVPETMPENLSLD